VTVNPPPLEVGEILRRFGPAYVASTAGRGFPRQEKVIEHLAQCRTAALGGTRYRCRRCERETVVYCSCRDRHCPKCQASARAEWLSAQEAQLLPVPYFHVVFTLPAELHPLALRNKREVYGWLFQAASRTLLEVGQDPKRLGVELGFLAVLHTWGQNLQLHPHVHCVVPGGGFTPEGRWRTCRSGFLLPVRVLSRVFRGKFLALLRRGLESGNLELPDGLQAPVDHRQLLDRIARKRWVVHAKAPFGGPRQVLKYLARYTHRVAISNQRLVSMEGRQVTFRWKDRAKSNAPRLMTLDALDFIRRFLLHLLPRGFHRIRQYGFLANCVREAKLALAREQLPSSPGEESPPDSSEGHEGEGAADDPTTFPPEPRCPYCGERALEAISDASESPALVLTIDTS